MSETKWTGKDSEGLEVLRIAAQDLKTYQNAQEMKHALFLVKKFHDDLFKKGTVPWGQTCNLDFGLMNETLLAVRAVIERIG